LDNLLIILVIGLALTVSVAAPVIGLFLMRHKDRAELDHYGKYRGSGPAKSFVCPECLTRSYAPSHVARRWCAKCQKSFLPSNADGGKVAASQKEPRWLTEGPAPKTSNGPAAPPSAPSARPKAKSWDISRDKAG